MRDSRVRCAGRRKAWTSTDDDVGAFLDAHAGEPLAADLRRTWLSSLGAREQWQAFTERFDPSIADTALRCQNARAQIGLATPSATAAATELWLTPQRLPPECEPVFEWLSSTRALTDDLVERRVRALLENDQAGFARTIAGRLPSARAAPLLQWADFLERPAAAIDIALSDPARARRTEDAMLLAGWTKLARSDPAAAQSRFERLAAAVGPERTDRYALALAFGLAWDRRATDALEAFAAVPAAKLDDYALSWAARSALWAGDWPASRAHDRRDVRRSARPAAVALLGGAGSCAASRRAAGRGALHVRAADRQLLRCEFRRAAEAPRGAASQTVGRRRRDDRVACRSPRVRARARAIPLRPPRPRGDGVAERLRRARGDRTSSGRAPCVALGVARRVNRDCEPRRCVLRLLVALPAALRPRRARRGKADGPRRCADLRRHSPGEPVS